MGDGSEETIETKEFTDFGKYTWPSLWDAYLIRRQAAWALNVNFALETMEGWCRDRLEGDNLQAAMQQFIAGFGEVVRKNYALGVNIDPGHRHLPTEFTLDPFDPVDHFSFLLEHTPITGQMFNSSSEDVGDDFRQILRLIPPPNDPQYETAMEALICTIIQHESPGVMNDYLNIYRNMLTNSELRGIILAQLKS